MADRLHALEELTMDMLGGLKEADVEAITEFVELRERLTAKLIESFRQSPPDTEEQIKLKALLTYDQQLTGKMDTLKFESSQWLLNRNQAKMQRSAYETAYSPDSLLMDRRK